MAEIEKFDPSTLMQGVKDRIKSTFVSLIPDEQWNHMVDIEIKKFFAPDQYGHSKRENPSDFTRVVHEELTKVTKEMIAKQLNAEDFELSYSKGSGNVSESIKNKIIEYAPQIFALSIESMVANVIQQMKNSSTGTRY